MKVIALACVARIESPMAYQGIDFPASRYLFVVLLPRPRYKPKHTSEISHPISTTQSSSLIEISARQFDRDRHGPKSSGAGARRGQHEFRRSPVVLSTAAETRDRGPLPQE